MAEIQRLLSMILWHPLDAKKCLINGKIYHLMGEDLVHFNFVVIPEVG